MSKSFVLNALRILGPEEILKLSQAPKVKQALLKKAAGEELIVWSEETSERSASKNLENNEAKILPFKRGPSDLEEPLKDSEEEGRPLEEASHFYSSEFLLWQRELSRETEDPIHKQAAVKGYQKSTEMYVVKSHDLQGKEKIRFVSTNGVLINKKQA